MTEMLDRIFEAKAVVEGERDNLLKALLALSAAGQITIIPQPSSLAISPVIVLPQNMYDRLEALTEAAHTKEGQG